MQPHVALVGTARSTVFVTLRSLSVRNLIGQGDATPTYSLTEITNTATGEPSPALSGQIQLSLGEGPGVPGWCAQLHRLGGSV